jgi:CRP-like cAMP-binding protein
LTEVAKVLTYEHFKKGTNVFDWGSFGDKFYIILRGKVSVMVPQEKLKKKVNTLVKEEMLKMYVK